MLQAAAPVTASTQYVPLSAGNYQSLERAVAGADAIFIGRVTDPGSEALLPPEAGRDGRLYRGVEIKPTKNLYGKTRCKVMAAVYVAGLGPASLLRTETPCIFFVQTHRQSWPCYPFSQLGGDDASVIVIKMIPATGDRLAEVKKQIAAAH